MPESNIYEVVDWNLNKFLRSPTVVCFKTKDDMECARRDIMNDKDIMVKTSDGVVHLPYTLLKQELYEGTTVFKAREVN